MNGMIALWGKKLSSICSLTHFCLFWANQKKHSRGIFEGENGQNLQWKSSFLNLCSHGPSVYWGMLIFLFLLYWIACDRLMPVNLICIFLLLALGCFLCILCNLDCTSFCQCSFQISLFIVGYRKNLTVNLMWLL